METKLAEQVSNETPRPDRPCRTLINRIFLSFVAKLSIDLVFTNSGGREFQMLTILLEKKFNCQLLLQTRNTANLKRAFITYVRPLLEYTSPVWSPSHLYLINEIENVQRSFTKRLPGLSTLSYSERLSILNLPTLEYRRLIADLNICFKIVHGFSCMNTDSFFTLSRNSSLRGHQFRFRVPLSKSNLRKFFFAHRVVQVWNSLPASIVAASSTRVFKSLVMKLDLSKFLHIVT